jgi:tRNA threonylcarbamoyladenosine biosynthesis protein TsaE
VSAAGLRCQPASAAETEALAARFAAARPPDGQLVVIFLSGELGTGKTTFARGFLAALGVKEAVRSPTYTLLELYDLGTFTAVHADLYRVRSAGELEPLGLRELARPGHLWLLEWPQRGRGALPQPDLRLTFSVAAGSHAIDIEAASPQGAQWLGRVSAAGAAGVAP